MGGVWFISFIVGHPGRFEEGCRNLLWMMGWGLNGKVAQEFVQIHFPPI